MTDREFPRVLAAEGISNFGAMLSRLAIPWLAVLSLQATPSQLPADGGARGRHVWCGSLAAPVVERQSQGSACRGRAAAAARFGRYQKPARLSHSSGWLGMIFATGALGAIIGASLAPRLGMRFGLDAGIRSAGPLDTLAGALVGGVMGDALGARSVLWLAVVAGGAAALLAAITLARPGALANRRAE